MDRVVEIGCSPFGSMSQPIIPLAAGEFHATLPKTHDRASGEVLCGFGYSLGSGR